MSFDELDRRIAQQQLKVARLGLQLAKIDLVAGTVKEYSLLASTLSVLACMAMALVVVLAHFNIMAGERLNHVLAITAATAFLCYLLHWLSGFLGLIVGPLLVIYTFSHCFVGTDSLWVQASTAPYVVEYWNKNIRPMETWEREGFRPREIPFHDAGLFKQMEFAKREWKDTWRRGDATIRVRFSDQNSERMSVTDLEDAFERQWTYFIAKIRETSTAPALKDAPVFMCRDNEYRWYSDAPGGLARVSGGTWMTDSKSSVHR